MLECLIALFGLANGGTTFLGGFLMKRFFLLFAASAMLLSFVSCSNGDDDNDNTGTQTTVTTTTDNTDSNSSGSTDSNTDTTGTDTTGTGSTGSNTGSGSSAAVSNPFVGNTYKDLVANRGNTYWYFKSETVVYWSATDMEYKYTFDDTTISLKRNGYAAGSFTYSFNEDKTVLTLGSPIGLSYTKQ